MSRMITLRACAVAGGAALGLALTVCTATTTAPATVADVQRLDLDLPATPPLDGTDAGLITAPAGAEDPDALADQADLAAQPPAAAPRPATTHRAPASTAPAPVVPEPAPVAPVAPEPVPAPVADEDPPGHQLPEEVIGSYRCPDPLQVIVALNPDGSTVCALPEDDLAPQDGAA